MAETLKLIALTTEQLAIIVDCPKLEILFSENIRHLKGETNNPQSLHMNTTKEAIGEALEILEDRLSKEGFDEKYHLNTTGKAIEGLVDQLTRIILNA